MTQIARFLLEIPHDDGADFDGIRAELISTIRSREVVTVKANETGVDPLLGETRAFFSGAAVKRFVREKTEKAVASGKVRKIGTAA